MGESHDERCDADQQRADHHPQGNPRQPGLATRGSDDLHADARRNRGHAGEDQERHGPGGPPAQEGPQAGRDRAPVTLMLGLDTNVLVRFLVRDHEAQFERVRRLIKREVSAQEKVLFSLLVLRETEWVLRSRYGLQKNQIADAISGLLDATELELEDEPSIEEALYLWKDSAADRSEEH